MWLLTKPNLWLKELGSFISLCDEVATIDQQSWVSIHVYVVEDWQ
jgi:hypothetical protein